MILVHEEASFHYSHPWRSFTLFVSCECLQPTTSYSLQKLNSSVLFIIDSKLLLHFSFGEGIKKVYEILGEEQFTDALSQEHSFSNQDAANLSCFSVRPGLIELSPTTKQRRPHVFNLQSDCSDNRRVSAPSSEHCNDLLQQCNQMSLRPAGKVALLSFFLRLPGELEHQIVQEMYQNHTDNVHDPWIQKQTFAPCEKVCHLPASPGRSRSMRCIPLLVSPFFSLPLRFWLSIGNISPESVRLQQRRIITNQQDRMWGSSLPEFFWFLANNTIRFAKATLDGLATGQLSDSFSPLEARKGHRDLRLGQELKALIDTE